MSSSDVARSERVLAKIGGALGLTEPGAEWLKAAVDPFHDTPLNVCGYPDVNEASSVVQVVKLSTSISAPASVTSPNNWDCHIHSFPWMSVSDAIQGITGPNSLATAFSGFGPIAMLGTQENNFPCGSLAYHSVPAGTATWTTGSAQPAIQFPFVQGIAPYLTGEYRIISKGYEVINTTSELNIQGLVTSYRQPFANIDSGHATLVYKTSPQTAAEWGTVDVIWDVFPPQNPGSALLLDGSKQWKAKEGAYVVDTLNSDEIPSGPNMTCVGMILPVTDPNYVVNAVSVCGATAVAVSTNTGGPTTTTAAVCSIGILPTAFNHSGLYFQGLSYTTTLTLNAIFYIERFPTQQDTDLVVLARRSPRCDSVAKSLYSEIIRDMPTGVPQRMNGLGEWFADAVSEAANFVAPVLGAIPTPITQGLSSAAKMAGNVAKSLGSKREAPSTYSASGSNTAAPASKVKAVMKAVTQVKKKKSATKKKGK
jgi:hypothetical protein